MVDGFVSDALANGRALRALTVVDNFTKEVPAIEVDGSLSAPRVTRVLDEVIELRGTVAESIRIDNGPEFTSRCFLTWAEQRGIQPVHIQPGKPTQNSFIESFNGRFRDECLNANWFETWPTRGVRSRRGAWTITTIGRTVVWPYRTPVEFARVWSPSPCATVVEQAGEPVKDSLTARKPGASLTLAPRPAQRHLIRG